MSYSNPRSVSPSVPLATSSPIGRDTHLAWCESLGLRYGPSFRLVDAVYRSGAEVLARCDGAADRRGFAVGPQLQDAVMQVGLHLVGYPSIPVGCDRVSLQSKDWPPVLWV